MNAPGGSVFIQVKWKHQLGKINKLDLLFAVTGVIYDHYRFVCFTVHTTLFSFSSPANLSCAVSRGFSLFIIVVIPLKYTINK